MGGSSKVSLMVLFQVLSPFSIVIGLILNELSSEDSLLPAGVTQSLNWFQENQELSNNLEKGFFVAAGIFTLLAILFSLSVAQGSLGSDDERISKDLGKIQ